MSYVRKHSLEERGGDIGWKNLDKPDNGASCSVNGIASNLCRELETLPAEVFKL